MKKGAVKHLKPILEDGHDAEKQEALKVLWELSFNKDSQHLIQEDASLMDLLNTLKKHQNKIIARNANGALWVLNMSQRMGKAAQKPVVKDGHVMISYQWGNQKMLLQIRDKLRENNFRVWIDVDNISGSTLQAMADAVEGASAVLMCMSQRYKDSPNCRTEAEYAFALNKPIIPLLMERSYRPNGWLGILLGSKLFFDFSGKYPFEKKLDELVRELGHTGLHGASEKDVTEWLKNNKLAGHKSLESLSGENIKFLQKLSQRAPEFFFTYLKQDLGLRSLNDLMNFSNAIDKLP
ncbi:hypothetical protein BaRGS_00040569 [Batillaria attramentaria]|uniref:TIR domain-containing protein n=1 Tax=Batillaria attramentaria TaxID=370345 RepID=A0ABD0IZK7_9CAEN